MPSAFLDRFTAEAYPRFISCFGWTVSLSRATATTTGVAALCDESEGRIESKENIDIAHVDRTWVIEKSAYAFANKEVEPRAGDRIIDSGGVEWEVLPKSAVPAAVTRNTAEHWTIATKRVKA